MLAPVNPLRSRRIATYFLGQLAGAGGADKPPMQRCRALRVIDVAVRASYSRISPRLVFHAVNDISLSSPSHWLLASLVKRFVHMGLGPARLAEWC